MIPRFIACALVAQVSDSPLITIEQDNTSITESCRIEIAVDVIRDEDGNGVIHIDASDVTIEFVDYSPALNGAPDDLPCNELTGIGIRIENQDNVTVRGAQTTRFKVGIYATNADGLTLDGCEVSQGFMQRLHSTKRAEDGRDWLWPHANDEHEWMTNYGAGIYVERSDHVTIRNTIARTRQNGIILDRVEHSRIYDNDCSFLSGWGLAMWRSSHNTISRNAFDFCIRGYSHGVYNRGQDSAGILMFEQCSDNVIAENSVTHGGDGLFAFAGKEALGETNPRDAPDWYVDRGNTGNMILRNDFSYAAAHGLELTFSAHNTIHANRFAGNAICGIWGGYSRDSTITSNHFEANGDMAYGLERGGINIEHGAQNVIMANRFQDNACGVHLWWDNDANLFETPWYQANQSAEDASALITLNRFDRDDIAIQLRHVREPVLAEFNAFNDVGEQFAVEGDVIIDRPEGLENADIEVRNLDARLKLPDEPDIFGESIPVGARADLRGREHIIMTEWGPYDWQRPHINRIDDGLQQDKYELLGFPDDFDFDRIETSPNVTVVAIPGEHTLTIMPRQSGRVSPYEARIEYAGETMHLRGVVADVEWHVSWFSTPADPRSGEEAWNVALAQEQFEFTLPNLKLDYAMGAPGHLNLAGAPDLSSVALKPDHFGCRARAKISFPKGRWRLRTVSDDGIRVRIDGAKVIDDWTWHAPKQHSYEFELDVPRTLDLLVEHFELDGYAILDVDFEPISNNE